MKIAFLHLSDIHFKDNDNFVFDKHSKIIQAIKSDIILINKIYIIITGDIAYSGKNTEYEIAKSFFNNLLNFLKFENKEIKFILIPGNHDCNFSNCNEKRKNNLKKIYNENFYTFSDKNTIINECLSVQKDYFDFCNIFFDKVQNEKLFFSYKDKMDNSTILFNCFNTSWVSELKEKPGKIFLPINDWSNTGNDYFENSLSISLLHHPLNWYNPNNNNHLDFRTFLLNNSNLVFTGHEHYHGFSQTINYLNNSENSFFIEGSVLQDSYRKESKFNFLVLDMINCSLDFKVFSYDRRDDFYFPIEDKKNIQFKKLYEKNKIFKLNEVFYNYLNDIGFLVTHSSGELSLNDIFVYPNLEKINDKANKILSSEKLINNNEKRILILSDDQAGKTTLCKTLYKNYYNTGFIPLLIYGEKIKNSNVDQIIKLSFQDQYNGGDKTQLVEKYKQLSKNKKVLFIDNFNLIKLNDKELILLTKKLNEIFDYIIITVNNDYNLENLLKKDNLFLNFQIYKILKYGYKLREKLINNWYSIGENNDDLIYENTIKTHNKINDIIQKNIILSYPIYILSILQSLEINKNFDLSQTSYGYCYYSLIYFSFKKNKLQENDIDSYFNFLTYFAFNLFKNDSLEFTESDLLDYIKVYKDKYILSSDDILDLMTKSLIFKKNNLNYINFYQEYIYYYFVGKYLAEHKDEEKEIILKLCKLTHVKKYANILLFLIHHTKDIFIIDEIQLNMMIIFEHYKPAILNSDETKFMQELTEIVSNKIKIENKNHKEYRSDYLDEKDKVESNEKDYDDNIDNIDIKNDNYELDDISKINQSIKIMEIIGQLLKNRHGSLPKDKLTDIITEAYNVGLRTLKYFLSFFEEKDIVNIFVEKIMNIIEEENKDDKNFKIDDIDRDELYKKVNFFISGLSYFVTFSIIDKIGTALGVERLNEIFNSIAENNNFPSYKLISFIIETKYSNKLSIDKIKKFVKEFDKNNFALSMLKKIVLEYIYMHNIDYKTKQQLATLLNIPIHSQLISENIKSK
ncbi:MAG: hypothetical protein A2086_01660 [Spirochaetes bacterium GWD1_27_9]|nr:MAG: hypothetical protein A2Z98_04070 [Spirochaetes bacterium GWB1_27_13]OHD20624.1 MAG: hypothetical protein A2Y34_17550 [Spirochaetes bacterium GWC1_27_15]OHD41809.1 MAG: hypothetical protein A2086_01660 [Spirochaetes bacterium GWD1_27_9]